ncbi:amidohydrolase family protein [Jeotgalicoccus nanhaiensis]|nr:amidohydrolase family protein [Jeotgalicoccus nanhaiensis]
MLLFNPAKEYGMYPQKGTVQTGSDADITIVDMDQKWKIDKQKLHSKSKVTAYDEKEITGKPVATIVNGVTVMENGEIVEELQGKPVLVK